MPICIISKSIPFLCKLFTYFIYTLKTNVDLTDGNVVMYTSEAGSIR